MFTITQIVLAFTAYLFSDALFDFSTSVNVAIGIGVLLLTIYTGNIPVIRNIYFLLGGAIEGIFVSQIVLEIADMLFFSEATSKLSDSNTVTYSAMVIGVIIFFFLNKSAADQNADYSVAVFKNKKAMKKLQRANEKQMNYETAQLNAQAKEVKKNMKKQAEQPTTQVSNESKAFVETNWDRL